MIEIHRTARPTIMDGLVVDYQVHGRGGLHVSASRNHVFVAAEEIRTGEQGGALVEMLLMAARDMGRLQRGEAIELDSDGELIAFGA